MESGKKMPLDPEPTREGNVIIRHGPRVGDQVAHVETAAESERRRKYGPPGGDTAYVSHYATCPQAAGWRKRG